MPDNELPLLPLILDSVPPGLRHALAQEGIPFRNRMPGLPEGRFLLFDSRAGSYRWIAPGQVAIDVDRLRHGSARDPFRALIDQRCGRHQWDIGGLKITEQIARVDKRAVRQRVLARLRAQIEQAGGIWLRVAAFPFPYRSALNFRVDHDQYDPHNFEATLQAIAGHQCATSHFVNGAAYQPHLHALARLRGLDVGSHGYWHHTYLSEEENLRNIRRGVEMIRAAGIEPSGFAAPCGRFNRHLLAALERLGVTHSSEFGLAYDELPFFPAESHVLQIPVHPVCWELLLEAAQRRGETFGEPCAEAAVDLAIDYFEQSARSKYRSGEPLFYYGHPTSRPGDGPQVLRSLLHTTASFGAIWKTTLTEFGAWWRVRAGVRLTVACTRDTFVVTAERLPADYRVAVEYWRGRHVALMPLDQCELRFSPAALAYESREAQPSVRPVRIDRPEGLRTHLKRIIDWERVTPIEEIASGNWRNWAKRTLRRWRAP